MLYQYLALLFVIFWIAYFVEVLSLARALKSTEIWSRIGSPDLFSPVGQAKFFSLVFGREVAVFASLPDGLKTKCKRIRVYILLGLSCFVVLILLMVVESN